MPQEMSYETLHLVAGILQQKKAEEEAREAEKQAQMIAPPEGPPVPAETVAAGGEEMMPEPGASAGAPQQDPMMMLVDMVGQVADAAMPLLQELAAKVDQMNTQLTFMAGQSAPGSEMVAQGPQQAQAPAQPKVASGAPRGGVWRNPSGREGTAEPMRGAEAEVTRDIFANSTTQAGVLASLQRIQRQRR